MVRPSSSSLAIERPSASPAEEPSMTRPQISAGDLIVVCDGRKAILLENAGDDVFPNLVTKEILEHPQAATHEQGSSPPGRVFASAGDRRSAVEQTDWHDEAERVFLNSLVGHLNSWTARSGGTRSASITIVAPPRALGMLRQLYSDVLRASIKRELAKDYVNLPVHEIEKRLKE